MTSQSKRFVGVDVHKHYVMVGAVDENKQTVIHPRKVSLVEFEGWAKKYLGSTDEAVLEATSNAWYVHDLLKPIVGRVVVGHPPHIKLITAAMVKTDKLDTMKLAKLLLVNLIPEVWVPPEHVRELRSLVNHRRRLVSHSTQIKNRLQSLLHRHHLIPPGGNLFETDNRSWWLELDLGSSEKLRIRQDLTMLDHLGQMIKETADELQRLSLTKPWVEQLPYLIQLSGIGISTAMVILSAIGDISRFPSAKKLVGYSGLGAKVHSSGLTHRTGGITKQGRKELRAVLVEAAWVAIRFDARWKEQFDRLAFRIGRHKAIVAIARKLLVVIWNVWFHKRADRHAEPEKVARFFIQWGRQVRAASTLGMNAAHFARRYLDLLGIGSDLSLIKFGCNYRLPPSQLVSDSEPQPSTSA